ncbi:tol-pal system protein YbgF [Methylobacter svalbardensis]|uniref:tol-pal system protein YbgF n=1 Tax=Methylobacter svalbardensis TaxID=3080016 RepID=UPI0030EEC458
MLLCVCGAVHAESLPPVIDNSMYPAGEVSAVQPSSGNGLYEMMRQLEQLQTEVRQLTGKLEEQTYLIAEMKKSQSTMYSDFDERMQSLEQKAEAAVKPIADENSPMQEGSVESEAKMVEPPVDAPEVKQTSEQEQDAGPAAGEASAPAPRLPPVGDEKQQYQQAYEALRNGHTAKAIVAFNAVLSKNPGSEYANNAQYWLGEAYRVNQDVDLARKAFNDMVEKYPDSTKVPDALLKLGYIEVEQKNTVKAREYLTRVTVDFPSSTAARLAAKKLLLLGDIK